MEYNDLLIPLFGTVRVTFTEANHAYVATDHSAGTGPVTVRGVQYYIGVHLWKWADGTFHIGEESQNSYERRMHLHVSRTDWGKPVSESARTKIGQEVTVALNNFYNSNKSVAVDAQREHLRGIMETLQRSYAEAIVAADKLRKQRDAAQDAYTNFLKEN